MATKKKIRPVVPPIPIIPQVWAMLHPAYTCDLCQKPISEEQYDHTDGLCAKCALT